MPWVAHNLGSLSLLNTGWDTTPYICEDAGSPPEEEFNAEYRYLGMGAGVRLANFHIGKAPSVLWLWGVGDDQGEADERRQAIQDQIDLALGGTVVTYQYQVDASAPMYSWRIAGGIMVPQWHDSQGQQVFGLPNGRFISIGKVNLDLSKG